MSDCRSACIPGTVKVITDLLSKHRPPSRVASMIGLSDGENRAILARFVQSQYQNVTDGRTDRRTDGVTVAIERCIAHRSALKMKMLGVKRGTWRDSLVVMRARLAIARSWVRVSLARAVA